MTKENEININYHQNLSHHPYSQSCQCLLFSLFISLFSYSSSSEQVSSSLTIASDKLGLLHSSLFSQVVLFMLSFFQHLKILLHLSTSNCHHQRQAHFWYFISQHQYLLPAIHLNCRYRLTKWDQCYLINYDEPLMFDYTLGRQDLVVIDALIDSFFYVNPSCYIN